MKNLKSYIPVIFYILLSTQNLMAFQGQKKVVIYNKLAYIIEKRELIVENGKRDYEIHGLPASTIPNSIYIENMDEDLTILKQEFNQEVFNWGNILRGQLGKDIEFILNDGSILNGEYFGQSGNAYIIRNNDLFTSITKDKVAAFDIPAPGRIEAFLPVFKIGIESIKRKNTAITLNYLVNNVSWNGLYTGVYKKDNGKLELRSWANIINRAGSDLVCEDIFLIAGDPSTISVRGRMRRDMNAPLALKAAVDESFQAGAEINEAGIYHSYKLNSRLNIENNKTQQIMLFDKKTIDVEQEYVYSAQENNGKVISGLRFKNDKDTGFGEPIPAGFIRLFEKDGERDIYLGEDIIRNTPVDRDVFVKIGTAFDLTGEKIQTDFKELRYGNREMSYKITLTNAGKDTRSVIVKEIYSGQWEVLSSSHNYKKLSTRLLQFVVDVPKEGKTEIEYRVRLIF